MEGSRFAAAAYRLYGMVCRHSGPFDGQLIVQALTEEMPIVTPDEKFRQYREVRVIW